MEEKLKIIKEIADKVGIYIKLENDEFQRIDRDDIYIDEYETICIDIKNKNDE